MLSRGILRHTAVNSRRAAHPTARGLSSPYRCAAASPRIWATTRWYTNDASDRKKSNFQGQVWENTYKRIQEEKAEIDRYLKEKEDKEKRQDSGNKWFANTLGVGIGWIITGAWFYWMGSNRYAPAEPSSTTPIEKFPTPKFNVQPANLKAAWSDFAALLGEANVSVRDDDKWRHSGSDWSSHHTDPNDVPFMVLYPATTEEVSGIMKICDLRMIPVTAFSGGTSLEGHFAATRGGVSVDFSRMDKILALHKEDLDVVVQPGVGWEHLNEQLEKDNLFFPPDPGPGAMIGGMVGTGCSGTNAARYGTMREWVLSLTVVLADGTIIKTRQRPRKSSAGYDLTKMFIGSEGTLGLVTEATLKLAVKPQSESVAVCAFPSIRAAANAVAKVMGKGIPVAAVEILDDVQMRCLNVSGNTERKWKEKPTLFFKFTGTQNGVKEQITMVREIAKSCRSESFEFATNKEEQEDLWSARKEALWSVMALKENDDDQVWTTDVAVPLSRLPDIIDETKKDISENKLTGSIVGHVGDGNFHCILLFSQEKRKVAEAVVHRMVERAIAMEGTTTGEHGVGLIKRDYLPKELGQTTVDAMRRLKQAFDPQCLLNCDKVVRVEREKKSLL